MRLVDVLRNRRGFEKQLLPVDVAPPCADGPRGRGRDSRRLGRERWDRPLHLVPEGIDRRPPAVDRLGGQDDLAVVRHPLPEDESPSAAKPLVLLLCFDRPPGRGPPRTGNRIVVHRPCALVHLRQNTLG